MTRQTAIYLRGPGRVEVDGKAVALRSKRIAALLTYLVAANRPVPRAELSELFWPDRDEKTARANLRWALSRLRAIRPDEALETTRRSAAFKPVPGVWVDVLALEAALREDDEAALETALMASSGSLMDGFFLDESPENARFFAGGKDDRCHFDLPGFSLQRLRDAGITAEWTRHCTYSDAERFYSYRRATHAKEADYGRLISAIRL